MYVTVSIVVPDGVVSLTNTVPSGPFTMTVMLSTLDVFGGTETELRMGVMPGVNGMMTDEFGSLKSTPWVPGLRSCTLGLLFAPWNVALLMYCGLPIPTNIMQNMTKTLH